MPTLELNINWSVFDQVQREMIQKAIDNGHYEQLAAILYEVTPEQAVEIEKIQRQMRPREFQFESQSQKEFEIWSSLNFNDLTPAIAKEWQDKIDKERNDKIQAMNGGLIDNVKVNNADGSNVTTTIITNQLSEVHGLGEASVKRLNAANIYSVDELRKLDQDRRKEILGPLVAAKIKSLT